jgi:putative component of toxin-antitoxin plasmid stabilization module
MGYIPAFMIEVRQTQEFSAWLRRLRDANAVARIVGRIRRMEKGTLATPEVSVRASTKCVSTMGLVTASTIRIAEHRL